MFVASLCALDTADAETQIHKCTDADGGVSYSQLPCPPVKVAPKKAPTPEEDDGEKPVAPTADRAACQKRYRDAIDAIDLEIGREYSADKADEYKRRLLELTRKLRRC